MNQSVRDFINGIFYGWTQVFIMQPFDRVKVEMQNNHEANNISACLRSIIKEEGITGLYKGSLVLLAGIGTIGSVRWGTFQSIKRRFKAAFGYQKQLPTMHILLAGFLTGIVSSVLVGPIQHMRTRIQIQKSAKGVKEYNGSLSAAVVIARKHGLAAIWKGQVATLIRESTGIAPYFAFIEGISEKLTPPGKTKSQAPAYVPILAGGVGGTSYWIFNYPIDFIKTKMQSDSFENPKYKGFIDCWKQEYSKGLKQMYRGFTICMLRSFPVNGGATFVYRQMQGFWQRVDKGH